jgi:PKD repeat protein
MYSNQSFWYSFLCCNILALSSLVAQQTNISLCEVKRIFEKDTLHICPQEAIRVPSQFIKDSITNSWFFGNKISVSNAFTPSVSGTYVVGARSAGCNVQDTFILVIKAIPKLNFQTTNACQGTPVKFRHKILLPNPQDSLYWQFGADLTLKTKDTLLQYSYTMAGNYSVRLTVLSQGCRDTLTRSINVFANPTVAFSGLKDRYCIGDPVSNLIGNPLGGLFSGPNVINIQNSPGSATFAPGNQPRQNSWVYYQFVDGNGCRGVDSQLVVGVFEPTPLALSPLNRRYCKDHLIVTVDLSPAGGVLSGTGFTTNTERNKAFFDPRSHTGDAFLIYTYVDTNSCVSVIRDTTAAVALPVVSIANIKSNYCLNEADVPLLVTPAGGTFTGLSLISNTNGAAFRPNQLLQNNFIVYAYTDQNGCKGADTVVVNNVFSRPQVSLSALAPRYCVDSPPVEVTLSPAGGTISGNGFVLNTEKNKATFIPRNPGRAVLLYTFTDANGCTASASDTTISFALPNVRLTDISPNYCIGDPDVALNASPAGGTFKGNNVIGNANGTGVFKPNSAEKNNTIIYTFTDQNGCTAADSFLVKEVFSLPEVTLSGLKPDYCENSPRDTLIGLPAGGTFSGDILTLAGNQGIFTTRIPQKYTFNYTYRDANGCINAKSFKTEVFAIPKINLGRDTFLVSGRTMVLNPKPENNPALRYRWSTGATTPSITIRNPGFYLVEVTLSSCIVADTIFIEIRAINAVNFQVFTYSKVYPNPTKNQLYIELTPLDNLPKSSLELRSLDGKLVYTKRMDRLPAGQLRTENIDVQFLKTGLYLVYVDNIPLGKVMIDP